MNRFCEDYLHHLALEKNASRNTIASYRLDIGRYLRFLELREVTRPDDITEGHAAEFLGTLRTAGLSPRSVTRCISSLNGFHKFMMGEGIAQKNPMEGIDAPRLERLLPDNTHYSEGGLRAGHVNVNAT